MNLATSTVQRQERYRMATISIHLKNYSVVYSTNNMRANHFCESTTATMMITKTPKAPTPANPIKLEQFTPTKINTEWQRTRRRKRWK